MIRVGNLRIITIYDLQHTCIDFLFFLFWREIESVLVVPETGNEIELVARKTIVYISLRGLNVFGELRLEVAFHLAPIAPLCFRANSLVNNNNK